MRFLRKAKEMKRIKEVEPREGRLEDKKRRLYTIKLSTLANMKPGIRMDLHDKLDAGVLVVPIDLQSVTLSIYKAVNAIAMAGAAMRAMGIEVDDVKALVVEVCTEDKIEYK